MRTRKLGSQGPEISVIGFGAWEAGGMAWGPNPPDDQTIRAIQTSIEQGMTWIDTAEAYGGGRSEELVGRAIRDREVMVFTKLAPKPAGSGFDAAGVRAGAEASLRRLGLETIDLYQLHWTDNSTPIEETWSAMASLVDDGLVKWIGVSNFSVELMKRCERIRHVDALQPEFSLLNRKARHELLPFCDGNGTGVIAYGPLAYGLLTGVITRDTVFSEDDWRGGGHGQGQYNRLFTPEKLEANLNIVDRLQPVADRLGATLAQLALAWVWHQQGATGAIAGSRSPEHVAENAGGGDLDLEPKDLDEIESILSSD